jgi:hypothetical protein
MSAAGSLATVKRRLIEATSSMLPMTSRQRPLCLNGGADPNGAVSGFGLR